MIPKKVNQVNESETKNKKKYFFGPKGLTNTQKKNIVRFGTLFDNNRAICRKK